MYKLTIYQTKQSKYNEGSSWDDSIVLTSENLADLLFIVKEIENLKNGNISYKIEQEGKEVE